MASVRYTAAKAAASKPVAASRMPNTTVARDAAVASKEGTVQVEPAASVLTPPAKGWAGARARAKARAG